MKLVILESPYQGDVERNVRYARAAMRDSLQKGEAPFASHLLYAQTGVLDDEDPIEREIGLRAGFGWRRAAQATVVYADLGISLGMQFGIAHATELGQPIEYRYLGTWS